MCPSCLCTYSNEVMSVHHEERENDLNKTSQLFSCSMSLFETGKIVYPHLRIKVVCPPPPPPHTHTRPSGNDLQLPIHCLDEYMEIPLSGFVVFNQVGGNMGGPFV